MLVLGCIFFFKQKTAYEMRISDWSSDVCSSDLGGNGLPRRKPQRGERVRLRHQFRGLIDDRNAGAAVALWPTDNRVPAEAGIQGHRAPLSVTLGSCFRRSTAFMFSGEHRG